MQKESANRVKLSNGAIVFVTPDVKEAAVYYRDVLGFRVVEHLDNAEPFATLYRDTVEIIIVQAKHGVVASNLERYGAGYDAYLDPERLEDVDRIFEELQQRGAIIVSPPGMTTYVSCRATRKDRRTAGRGSSMPLFRAGTDDGVCCSWPT